MFPEPQINPAVDTFRWVLKYQIALSPENLSNKFLKLSPAEILYRIKAGLILQHFTFAELIKKRENCRCN
jgi:hypothetical protein